VGCATLIAVEQRQEAVAMPAPFAVPFGDLLRGYRLAAGLTQDQLAERARLSVDAIGTLERGVRRSPRKETVALLSEALGLTGEDQQTFLAAARPKRSPTPVIAPPRGDVSSPGATRADPTDARPDAPSAKRAEPEDSSAQAPMGVRQRPPATERKLVTLLFADVSGSVAPGEALDPDDTHALVERFYEHARRVIAEHGGTLHQVVGAAVMAVFGLPRAHGNDVERALAAALALRAAVAGDPPLAERLLVRIGVSTGEVVATRANPGAHSLLTGDAVNMAARLQEAAHPGEILAGRRAQGAGQVAFSFGEARSCEAPGTGLPLDAFPLIGPRPARAMSRPPLVGRRRELTQLDLLRAAALEERRPQAVSVVAPAGTGKTRLLEEFIAGLDPAEGWRVATARCLPYGQTLTYWPLRGLLDDLLGGSATGELVAAAFTLAGYSQEDADRLAGLALAPLGITPEASAERERFLPAWRLLIEALALRAPRVILFEDLHWASDSLLDLVEYVLRPRTEAQLLLVATSRPELLDRRPAWGGGLSSLTALALAPLSGAQTGEMVTRLAEGIPDAVRARIVERSGGNPFFAIELAQAVIQGGVRADRATGALPDLPDTVHEAALARLDLLTSPEREALRTASVVGRAFRPAALQALGIGSQTEVEAALGGLLARDLIVPAEGGAYAFRHILFREVAYGTLSRAERIRLHAALAQWLERFAAQRLDEFTELIAYHWREAAQLARHSAVPLDAPVDTARAVHFLERAGELASRVGAYIEARSYLQSAIELAPAAESARLYEALGDCLASGDIALGAYRRALEAWRADAGRTPLVGARLLRKLVIVLGRWCGALSEQMSREEVEAQCAEARRLAEEADDIYELWRVRCAALFSLLCASQYSDLAQNDAPARAALLEAAAYFEARDDWDAFSEALDFCAIYAREVGDYAASAAASQRRLAAPALSAYERGDALAMLAEGQTESGAFSGALLTVQAAIALRRSGEPGTMLGYAAAVASLAAYLAGRWSEVADLAAVVDEAWEEWQGDPWFFYLPAGYFALLGVALAREDGTAPDRAAAAERLVAARRLPAWQALLMASRRDDAAPLQAALQSITSLADVSPHVGFWSLILPTMFLSERGLLAPTRLLDLLATREVASGHVALRHSAAIAMTLAGDDAIRLAATIEEAEAAGLIPHAARMRIVLAQRTGDRTQLDRVRVTLERLGDRQFLRRLDAVAAALR
jgi:class 3 adenylate cyclase